MSPPLPQNKQTEISENTITKKNPQRDLSQSIYKDVTRSYFECKPLAYCRQKKNRTKGKGGVEENTEKERVRQMEECFGFNNI